jgi:holliday junction DNA helicase RuvB
MKVMEYKLSCGMRAYAEFELASLDTTPDVRRSLEPLVLDVLFEYAARQHAQEGGTAAGTAQLSIAQALDVLTSQKARWQERLRQLTSPLKISTLGVPRDFGTKLNTLLQESHLFFRREGAGTFRIAAKTADSKRRFGVLWADLFSRCVLDWLREEDLLGHVDRLETADMLVECLKLWVHSLSAFLGKPDGNEPDPSHYFNDLENDVTATFERGPIKLKIRGRPIALQINGGSTGYDATSYQYCDQDAAELQIAQFVLWMSIMERSKATLCRNSTIVFFNPASNEAKEAYPAEVHTAFDGYVGNAIGVQRLKRRITKARSMSRSYIVDNYLLAGTAGMGKTELARRIAKALDVPFVPVHVTATLSGCDVVSALDEALGKLGKRATSVESEGDRETVKYPPLFLYFDDVHELRNRANQFLNLLEPRDRRVFGSDRVGLLSEATIVASTDDATRLTEALQSRFRRIDLDSYRDVEVAEIVTAAGLRAGVALPRPVALLLSRMGKYNPRRATAYANDLCVMHATVPATAPISRETIMVLGRRDWKVDEHGLSDRDYQYLRALESGPKGLPALQQLLPTGGDDFVRVIEPYLLQIGAISRSNRGRSLTVIGEQLLYRRAASHDAVD